MSRGCGHDEEGSQEEASEDARDLLSFLRQSVPRSGEDDSGQGPMRVVTKRVTVSRNRDDGWASASYHIKCGGDVVARIQRCEGGWYWYTLAKALPFVNTYGVPTDQKIACEQAVAYVRKHLT